MILINCDSRPHDTNSTTPSMSLFDDERDRNDPSRIASPGRKVLEFIDAREVSPLASSWDMFNVSKNTSSTGKCARCTCHVSTFIQLMS